MTATQKKTAEPRTIPVQSRVLVTLIPQDAPSSGSLAAEDRGPWSMSPRNFATGQLFRIGNDYYRIQAVIHDPADPAGVTLLVSVLAGGLQ
jgi:hypothetical protein